MKSKKPKEVKKPLTCSICGSKEKVKALRNDVYCGKCLMVHFYIFEDKSYPSCEECGSIYRDPAIKKITSARFKMANRARINQRTVQGDYMCSWCSMKKGGSSFISDRVLDDLADKKIIVSLLRLVKEGEPESDSKEDLKVLSDFEWYEYDKEGKEFGDEWQDYHIRYTGVLFGEKKDPAENIKISAPLWLIWHPEDSTKLVWIFRSWVFYKNSLAFAEILQNNLVKVKESIQNAQRINTKAELEKVWKGFQLFRELKKNSGRPPKFCNVEDFKEKIGAAYKYNYGLMLKDEISPDPTRLDIAAFIGISEAAFYDTCNRFDLDLDQYLREIKAEIESET
jgi:hypothetical protein